MNIKLNVKKNRRGRRKRVKHLKTPIRFLGVNANGLKPRMFTFKKVLKDLKPSVFLVEETKHKEDNKMKIENFTIFELTRNSRNGGGELLMNCVLCYLGKEMMKWRQSQ